MKATRVALALVGGLSVFGGLAVVASTPAEAWYCTARGTTGATGWGDRWLSGDCKIHSFAAMRAANAARRRVLHYVLQVSAATLLAIVLAAQGLRLGRIAAGGDAGRGRAVAKRAADQRGGVARDGRRSDRVARRQTQPRPPPMTEETTSRRALVEKAADAGGLLETASALPPTRPRSFHAITGDFSSGREGQTRLSSFTRPKNPRGGSAAGGRPCRARRARQCAASRVARTAKHSVTSDTLKSWRGRIGVTVRGSPDEPPERTRRRQSDVEGRSRENMSCVASASIWVCRRLFLVPSVRRAAPDPQPGGSATGLSRLAGGRRRVVHVVRPNIGRPAAERAAMDVLGRDDRLGPDRAASTNRWSASCRAT